MGLLESLRQGLSKTRAVLAGGLKKVLFLGRRLDESLIADLETVLLKADVGPQTTASLLSEVRAAWKDGRLTASEDVAPFRGKFVEKWSETLPDQPPPPLQYDFGALHDLALSRSIT